MTTSKTINTLLVIALSAGTVLGQAPVPPDENPRSVGLVDQFLDLRTYPDAMGARVNPLFPLVRSVGWTTSSHIQGVARSPRPGMPDMYFAVSGSPDPRERGFISTAQMVSRDRLGERMRSNRLGSGLTADIWPPGEDQIVDLFEFDGLSGPGEPLYWGWRHPGNLGVIGDVLFTPLEDKLWTNPAPWQSALALFDIGPDGLIEPINIVKLNDNKAGVAAMTRLSNGRYFLLIAGPNQGRTLVAYMSNTTSLRDPDLAFTQAFRWSSVTNSFGNTDFYWPWDNEGVDLPGCNDGTDSHQGYSLIWDQNGRLYLIGMTRRGSCGLPFGLGVDFADLFEVDLTLDAEGNPTWMRLTALAGKSFTMSDSSIGFNANFVGGAGVHISPSGTLILYGAPHGPAEPPTGDNDSQFLHFAEIRPTRANSTLHPGPGTAYLELFEDDGFEGRSIVLDYQDRFERPWWNLGFVDNFNDRMSSLKYYGPLGFSFFLYRDSNFNWLLSPLVGVDRFIVMSEYGAEDEVSSVGMSGGLSMVVYVGPPVAGQTLQTGQPGSPTWTVNGGLAQSAGLVESMTIREGFYPERVTFMTPLVVNVEGAGRVVIGAGQ
jgi:hypothetical protein